GSRRDALKWLGGLLAGGLLTGFTGKARADDDGGDDDDDDDEENEAINKACRKYCKDCPRRPEGVHGRCIRRCQRVLRKNPRGTLCGTCTATQPFTGCVAGNTCCTPTGAAAFCTNTSTDANNCGACGKVCPTANPNCCASACTNTGKDANNCGSCGNKCPTANPNCCAGKCTNTQTDANNCGACGNVCPTATPKCTAGKCTT